MHGIEDISARMSVAKTDTELSIVIASVADRRQTYMMGFWLMFWLALGVIGIVYLFFLPDKQMRVMLLVWLGFWIYFAYTVGKAWLWKRYGYELIKVREGKLVFKRDVRGRGFVNTYPTYQIQQLRANASKSPGWVQRLGGNYLSTEGESIVFDMPDKEIRFGYQLSQAERDAVIRLLRHYMRKK
jgi:hypothetical protein